MMVRAQPPTAPRPRPRPRRRRGAPLGFLLALSLTLTLAVVAEAKRPPRVEVYDGFGTSDGAALIRGRVVRGGGPLRGHGRGKLCELGRSLRLLLTRGVPGQTVEVRSFGRRHQVRSDERGFFQLELRRPRLPTGTFGVSARLTATPGVPGRGRLAIWPARGGAVVISDIDDTIIDSCATNKIKLVWRSLTSRAEERRAFSGAARLYSELAGRGIPIIYVSSAPVTLRPRIMRTLAAAGFPRAPLLLKDPGRYGLLEHDRFKRDAIEQVLAGLPRREALLIGDSGERDPEIYRQVRAAHPSRTTAVLIHRVTDAPASSARLRRQLVFDSFAQARRFLRTLGVLAADPGQAPPTSICRPDR